MTDQAQLTDTHKMILSCMSLLPGIEIPAKELFEFMEVDSSSMPYVFDALEDLKDYGWIESRKNGYIIKKDDALLVHQLIKPTVKKCYRFINYFLRLYSDITEQKIEALKKYELHVISILQNLTENSALKAALINAYANFLVVKKQYDEASLLISQAIEIQKEVNEKHPQIAIFYNDLSKIFLEKENYEKARQLARKSLEIIRIHQNNKQVSDIQVNSYYIISESYYKQKNYRLSLTYLLRALEIANAKTPEKHDIIALLHHQIANIYRHLKDYTNALLHINKAITHTKEQNPKQRIITENELQSQREAYKQLIRHQAYVEKLQKAGYAIIFLLLAILAGLGIYYFVR